MRSGCTVNGSLVGIGELGGPGTESGKLDISNEADVAASDSGTRSVEIDSADVPDTTGEDGISGWEVSGSLEKADEVGNAELERLGGPGSSDAAGVASSGSLLNGRLDGFPTLGEMK